MVRLWSVRSALTLGRSSHDLIHVVRLGYRTYSTGWGRGRSGVASSACSFGTVWRMAGKRPDSTQEASGPRRLVVMAGVVPLCAAAAFGIATLVNGGPPFGDPQQSSTPVAVTTTPTTRPSTSARAEEAQPTATSDPIPEETRPTATSVPKPVRTGELLVADDGGVFTQVQGVFAGSLTNLPHRGRAVGIALTPSGGGYWIAASDGGVYAFGDARFYGSGASRASAVDQEIVGIAATPRGDGYWLLGKWGRIYSFGNAEQLGHYDPGSDRVAWPFTGISPTPDGGGYWIVNQDGAVYAFGNAQFYGRWRTPHTARSAFVIGIAATASGLGYWLLLTDGGVLSYGDASFHGSAVSLVAGYATAVSATLDGEGYIVTDVCGNVSRFHRAMGVTQGQSDVGCGSARVVGIAAL